MPSNIVSLNKRFGRQCFKLQTEIKCENVIGNWADRLKSKLHVDKTYKYFQDTLINWTNRLFAFVQCCLFDILWQS